MKNLRQKLIDYEMFNQKGNPWETKWSIEERVDHYLKSINYDPNECEPVRHNKQAKEHCTFPDGKDNCNYKSKDYLACVLLRKCKWAISD